MLRILLSAIFVLSVTSAQGHDESGNSTLCAEIVVKLKKEVKEYEGDWTAVGQERKLSRVNALVLIHNNTCGELPPDLAKALVDVL